MILPQDPDIKGGGDPLIMGDPYANALTPKLAQVKRNQEFDAERKKIIEKTGSDWAGYANSHIAYQPDPGFMRMAQATGVSNMMTQPMWFSPLHTAQNWQTASKRREVYQWARFFYENEPKVAAAIDFYSRFPMNGFKLECVNRKVLSYFEHNVVDRLKLNEKFKMISSEYFMLGDVFIHMDISCPVCQGSAIDPDTGEMCDHPGGSWKRMIILNPDWIEVQQSVLADEPSIVMIPDEDLKRIVFYKQPKVVYDRIPDRVKQLVIQNKPIPLSNRTVSHIRHMPVPYGTYGTSLIRRLFTTLAYKTKIMTANWIVAERLILPVRVVKIGSDNRPATTADIADIQQQLGATANDPNLTIVTHHNFEYEWYGASGKILQVTQEMEFIGKEVLDGFMLNQSLLNGEMCIPETDQMLTKDGFKSLEDISKDDEIATYNRETGQLEYQKPSAIHVYDYDGELLHFQTDRIDFACTPNHRMYFQKRDSNEWNVDVASNVKNRSKFLKQVKWNPSTYRMSDEIAHPDFAENGLKLDQYLKIVAYYVSEGHLGHESRKNRKDHNKVRSVYIAQTTKGKGWEDLCVMQEESSVYSVKNTRHGFAIYNSKLAQHLLDNCGELSEFKYVPQYIKELQPSLLRKFLGYLINGDGSLRTRDKSGPKRYYTYYTKSKTLRDDVMEISIKCGYFPRFRHRRNIWEITFSDYDLSKQTIPLDSKKYKTITSIPYKGKVWCVTVPNGTIITERNGKLMYSLNSGYQSAQVGVETLIRRIESWRHTLAEWCEENVFKPIAEMQGFIDKEKSNEVGELCFLYPTIKWNDLNLKDKTQWYQVLMQLHDKQVISTQTLMEEMDLNYDQEVKRQRYETSQGGGLGMGGMPGGAGGAGGMPGGGGGGPGGMPGGDMGGGMGPAGAGLGGDMGGMGGMMGGAPGMGGGGAPGMGAAASGGKVMKKGKGDKQPEVDPEQMAAAMPMIKLTEIEQRMAGLLLDVATVHNIPKNAIRVQFPVSNPQGGKPNVLDFAIPHLKIGIEADGELWHSQEKQEQSDQERDQLLAQRGWTILRFDDKVIDDAPQSIKQTVSTYIEKAHQQKKQASVDNISEIHLFSSNAGKIVDLSTNYEAYKEGQRVYYSKIIGNRENAWNYTYDGEVT